MGLPRELQADNQSIISSSFFNALCNLAGIEQAKSVMYRPKCNGSPERAVQSTVYTLRQYLLSRKMSWLEALPLALWGLTDLLRAVAPYSPDRLVFGRDPIGVGDLPPVVDSEGCEEATHFLRGWLRRGNWYKKTWRQYTKNSWTSSQRNTLPVFSLPVTGYGSRTEVKNEKSSVEHCRDPLRSLTGSLTPFTRLTIIWRSRTH